MRRALCLLLMLLFVPPLPADDQPFTFEDPRMESRYEALIAELRCLVCQNQSLSDSHASLAQDLRQEVYDMLMRGDSDAQIIGFLTDRYGDFVLYRPPFKAYTALLWLGPALFLLGGAAVAVGILRRRRPEPVAPEDLAAADELLRQSRQAGDDKPS